MKRFDVIVIGGGQSGLAIGYYLRRSGLSYSILDNQKESGGSWSHNWKSLRLFSPAQWSSLPGMIMNGGGNYYPTRDEVIGYLKSYEAKYQLQVQRSVDVRSVSKINEGFELETSNGIYHTKAVVSATGSFGNPYVPAIKGKEHFKGLIIHSNQYLTPDLFIGKRVAIVGEGNSGAQILAEVSKVAQTIWITLKVPRFLPDHVDGRYLFDAATQMYEAQKIGKDYKPPSLGDIVMVDSVKDARERNVLVGKTTFDHFTEDSLEWLNGAKEKIDAVIFCTGFKPSLKHLSALSGIPQDSKPQTSGTKSNDVEGLWFVGYGSWTGFASATLVGVGRSAKTTVEQITEYINSQKKTVSV